MEEEYNSLMKNNTWDLVPLPKGRQLVWSKWNYWTKFLVDGSMDKYKVHLVSKCFSHVHGIDYTKRVCAGSWCAKKWQSKKYVVLKCLKAFQNPF